MGNLFKELEREGCPVDEIRERFLDDEDFYHSCLIKVIKDKSFEKLGEALCEQNAKVAFVYAHTLKGVISNMGLSRMYGTICEIVEPLRKGETSDLLPYYGELLLELEEIKYLCAITDDK